MVLSLILMASVCFSLPAWGQEADKAAEPPLDPAQLDLQRLAGSGPGAPSGPPTVAGGSITSLDFVLQKDRSRLIIGLPEAVTAQVWPQDGERVVVEVPGCKLSAALARPLDTSGFDSVVSHVQALNRPDGCRVEVLLRRAAGFEANRRGDFLILDLLEPLHEQPEPAPAVVVPTVVFPSVQGEGGFISTPGSGAWSDLTALGVGQRISLDLVNADIHNVLRLFADVGHINVVAGDDVQGLVTVRMVDVPWDQALAAILASQGLGWQVFGGGIVTVRGL